MKFRVVVNDNCQILERLPKDSVLEKGTIIGEFDAPDENKAMKIAEYHILLRANSHSNLIGVNAILEEIRPVKQLAWSFENHDRVVYCDSDP